MITNLVILAVTSNVVLSLGMVGALSIVRFRTAIKEPLDIAFLFWSIAAGIVLAAGMIPLAVIGSIIIGAVLIIFVNKKAHINPYIAVIKCDSHESEAAAHEFLTKQTQRCTVKSKTAVNRDERRPKCCPCKLQRRIYGINREKKQCQQANTLTEYAPL